MARHSEHASVLEPILLAKEADLLVEAVGLRPGFLGSVRPVDLCLCRRQCKLRQGDGLHGSGAAPLTPLPGERNGAARHENLQKEVSDGEYQALD